MGWFNKNKKEEVKKPEEIPSLPKLPELPRLTFGDEQEALPQLPRFPTNSFGEKFSQNAIKDAVTGQKEDEGLADDFSQEYEVSRMPEPAKIESPDMTRELEFEEIEKPTIIKSETKMPSKKLARKEPVFIRVDKFEQALKTFTLAKEKTHELEKMLQEVRKIKDQEEKELAAWETEIQSIKSQIEKVDQDIFSKIE